MLQVEETKLDVMQFHEAIKERFRYVSTPWLLDDVFKAVDVDGNQVVGIDELWDWLRGKRYPLDRRSLTLRDQTCILLHLARFVPGSGPPSSLIALLIHAC